MTAARVPPRRATARDVTLAAMFLAEQPIARMEFCERTAEKRWLCSQCPTPLASRDAIACEKCLSACSDAYNTQIAIDRDHAWRERLATHAEPGLRQLPSWPWARVDSDVFQEAVRPYFQAVAEKWGPGLGNLVLLGISGTGKSASIVAALWRVHDEAIARTLSLPVGSHPDPVLEQVRGLLYLTGHDLTVARKQAQLGAEAPKVQAAMTCPLLLLDELGFDADPDRLVAQVIDARYRLGLPLVVASALTIDEIGDIHGDHVKRRLTIPGTMLADVHAETQ